MLQYLIDKSNQKRKMSTEHGMLAGKHERDNMSMTRNMNHEHIIPINSCFYSLHMV